MATVSVSEDKLNKVLADMENLVEDVASLLDQDEIAKKRLNEIKADQSIGKSEQELDSYLKKRGVKVD